MVHFIALHFIHMPQGAQRSANQAAAAAARGVKMSPYA